MARDLNSVVIIGHLTQAAEFKVTPTGKELLKFRIANNRGFGNQDNKDDVSFFDVTLWGKPAVALKDYLTKGKQIAIQGRLQQQRWEQDGQQRSRVEIVAENVQLLGGGQQASSGGRPPDGGTSRDPVNPTPEEMDAAAAKLNGGPANDEIPF